MFEPTASQMPRDLRQQCARCCLAFGRGFDRACSGGGCLRLMGPVRCVGISQHEYARPLTSRKKGCRRNKKQTQPLFALGVSLITIVIFLGLKVVLPIVALEGTAMYHVHAVNALFLFANIAFNYIMGVATDAGTPASNMYKRLLEIQPALPARGPDGAYPEELLAKTRVQVGGVPHPCAWRICKRTGMPKPPRTHFDKVSQTLVVGFDHYCPWLWNAVGHCNVRFFVLFLFWLLLGCVYTATMTVGPFLRCLHVPRRQREYFLELLFLLMLTFFIGMAVSMLLGFHLYLVLTAQSQCDLIKTELRRDSYETVFRKHNMPGARDAAMARANLYDRGMRANFELVFGPVRTPWRFVRALLPSRRGAPFPPWPRDLGNGFWDWDDEAEEVRRG